ncbi:MAG: DUF5721 family protein [Eubacterium sp.]|nr:DUF5721 family protein [Eubacterium sp.]
MISEKYDNIKSMVSRLIQDRLFADFLLCSMEVKNACCLEISGRKNKDFFDNPEEYGSEEYIKWEDAREIFFQSIKGSRLPVAFKLVFLADKALTKEVLEAAETNISENDISSLSLNVYYDRTGLTITGGTALKIFTMDKSIENSWDNWIRDHLMAE